jgi:hypothetical protein
LSGSRLAELAEEAAAETAGALAETDGATTIWSLAGKPFAVLAGDTMEFRLDVMVGEAARRTPGTTMSARGADWVAFRPGELDQYAEDRARAWFMAAARRVATGQDA